MKQGRVAALLALGLALPAGCKEPAPPGPPPSPGEVLFRAVAQNQLDQVKRALAAGANPNERQKIGLTPGWQKIINLFRHLVRSKPYYRGARWTPLHLAASRGFAPIVRLLLAARADPNVAEDSGYTPLHLAVEGGHLAATRALLAVKPHLDVPRRDGKTPLMLAADRQDARFVGALLDAGANPRVRTESGWTALHGAATSGAARALIRAGADVNASAQGSGTPLSLAVFSGRTAVVRALLAAKADVERDEPLRHALRHRDLTIAKLLLGAAARVRGHSRPLLVEAVLQRNPGAARLLLQRGADVNRIGGVGMGALHHAASRGYLEIARTLLDAGADVNLRHRFFGRTPLDEASSPAMRKLLRSRGGRPGASFGKKR